MLLHAINNFVRQLQKKDEQTKKQWLIGSTAASMVLVLIFWGFYFSATIQSLSDKKTAPDGIGFAATLSQGMKVIGDKIGSQISTIMESAQRYTQSANSITIQPTAINFSNNIEPITPKKFP